VCPCSAMVWLIQPATSASFFFMTPRPPSSTLFPYTTLFRSIAEELLQNREVAAFRRSHAFNQLDFLAFFEANDLDLGDAVRVVRSEEHTSELQSRENLVCRLLLEKKKKHNTRPHCKCCTCAP